MYDIKMKTRLESSGTTANNTARVFDKDKQNLQVENEWLFL